MLFDGPAQVPRLQEVGLGNGGGVVVLVGGGNPVKHVEVQLPAAAPGAKEDHTARCQSCFPIPIPPLIWGSIGHKYAPPGL